MSATDRQPVGNRRAVLLSIGRSMARSPATAARAWQEQVNAAAADGPKCGTRWASTTGVFIPGLVATVGIGYLLVQGVLAAGVNFADQPVTASVSDVTGQGMVAVISGGNRKLADGSIVATATLHGAARSADLNGLCATIKQTIFGRTFTVVAVGDGPTHGENLLFDVLDADATTITMTGNGATVGRSADEITYAGQPIGGQPGGFGIDAMDAEFSVKQATASAYGAQILGSMDIAHIKLEIKAGDFDC